MPRDPPPEGNSTAFVLPLTLLRVDLGSHRRVVGDDGRDAGDEDAPGGGEEVDSGLTGVA